VCERIGQAIGARETRYHVVVRSTILPGVTSGTVVPTLEQVSGKRCGEDFGVCLEVGFANEIGRAVQGARHRLQHVERGWTLIIDQSHRRVRMLGLTFKMGTDHLRESPFGEIAERLIGKGYQLRTYDPYVKPSMVIGANREYIEAKSPQTSRMMVDCAEELVIWGETVIVGDREPLYPDSLTKRRAEVPTAPAVADLAGLAPE
jgi:UDP-N-acetyl-D-mannosaminuronate dehydrogenase